MVTPDGLDTGEPTWGGLVALVQDRLKYSSVARRAFAQEQPGPVYEQEATTMTPQVIPVVQTGDRVPVDSNHSVPPDPSSYLFDADPDCEHDVVALWSGVKCSKCPGWFCY